MPVNSRHPLYEQSCKRWETVRKIVANDATSLLRTVDPNNSMRSNQYKKDAILTNFTRLTKEGLTGLVFRKDSKKQLPPQIEYIEDDATGYKFGLDQLAHKAIGEILETGRYGLLVDYPSNKMGKARIRPYNTESIINWKYEDFGDEYRLSLLVLKEDIQVLKEDGFDWEKRDQYRVLRLDEDGNYYQVLYNHDLQIMPETAVMPLDYNGVPLEEIPFVFVGSEDNDADIDSIPLYDLSVVNLGHYKASADLMESMFICGQPVPVVNTGESGVEDWHQANPNGITIGSRSPVVVGNGGSFEFKQVSSNTLPQQVMSDLEKQAAAIGARLIAPPGGRETAEAARIRYGSQNSVLYTITKNLSEAIEMCLMWVAQFMMEKPEPSEYELNDQFYEENADPNLIAQELMMLDRGLISEEEIRDNLRRTGMKLRDDFTPDPVDPMDGIKDEGGMNESE